MRTSPTETGSPGHLPAHLGHTQAKFWDDKGVAQYQQVLELARSARDDMLLCWTHCRLGDSLFHLARYDPALVHLRQFRIAEEYCRQALAQVERTQDVLSIVLACMGLAELHSTCENYPTARTYAQRAVEFAERIRSTERLAHALIILADCEWALGDLDAAGQGWQQAAGLLRDLGQPTAAQRARTRLTQLPPPGWKPPSARTNTPNESGNNTQPPASQPGDHEATG